MDARPRSPGVPPYWTRPGSILAYPLQPDAIGTIGMLSLARLLGHVPGPAGWFLDLLVTIAILRYAGEVLYYTAHGRLQAPPGIKGDDARGWTLFWVLLALLLFLLAARGLAGVLGAPWIGLAGTLLFALAMPGAAASVVIDGDGLRALDPRLWLAVALRLGAPWLLLAGLCLLAGAGTLGAQRLLQELLPGPLATVAGALVLHYALVVAFHLMGYAIWQYGPRLGFEPGSDAMLPVARRDPDAELLAQAEALASRGDPAAAEELLRGHLRERGGGDALRARHREFLRRRGDLPGLLADGRDAINVLLARNDERRAVAMWHECLGLDPGFLPADPDQVHRLASRAAAMGLNELALRAASRFESAFPKHPDVPRNGLLAARLLAGRAGDVAAALALLRRLQAAWPQHPLAGEIEALARSLEAKVTPPRREPPPPGGA